MNILSKQILGITLLAFVTLACGTSEDECTCDTDCPGLQVCIDNRCVTIDPSCPAVPCEEGMECVGGTCYPVDCATRNCPGLGEVCVDQECQPASCIGVECPSGQSCAAGGCYPDDCDTRECPGYGEVCVEEDCVERSCVEVVCPPGQRCAHGICYPSDCEDIGCPAEDEVCVEGECRRIACLDVECPAGTTCVDGWCVPAACEGDAACDDANPCTDDRCDPVTGCVHLNNDLPCDDEDPCTMEDRCSNGVCAGVLLDSDRDGFGSDTCGGDDCDDENPGVHPGAFEGPQGSAACSDGLDNDCDGRVDLDDATCQECDRDADCDDGNACNGAEECTDSVCRAGNPLDCDDHNECTSDGCDPASGCTHTPAANGTECGTRLCIGFDWSRQTCVSGSCVGTEMIERCSDGNICTDDACDSVTGCSNVDNTSACDDGDPCTGPDVCGSGVCRGTPFGDTVCGDGCCTFGEVCLHGSCCDPTWRTVLPNTVLRGLALDTNGDIYVSGKDGQGALYVARLDACGNVVHSRHWLPGGTEWALANAMAIHGDKLYLAGSRSSSSDPRDGLLVRLDKNTLAADVLWPVAPTTGSDELWDVQIAGDGRVWVNGTTQFDVSARPYGIKSVADGQEWCGWEAPFVNQGLGRGITSHAGMVYMTGIVDGQAAIHGYLESSCSLDAPCACLPEVEILFTDGVSQAMEGREIVVSGPYAYVGGHRAVADGDTDPFVAQVDLTSGEVLAWLSGWHPTDHHDSYFGIEPAEIDHGIGVGYMGLTESQDQVRGFIQKIRGSDLAVVWTHEEQTAPSAFFRSRMDAAGGIIVIGQLGSISTGVVQRCLGDGTCP